MAINSSASLLVSLAGLAVAAAVALASTAAAAAADADKLVLAGQGEISIAGRHGLKQEASDPHAGDQSQTHVHNYGDVDRTCTSWTDRCRTCTRGGDGALLLQRRHRLPTGEGRMHGAVGG